VAWALALALVALAAAAGCPASAGRAQDGDAAPGQVVADAAGEPPPLSTWVDDWRDEVIYHLLVDRFANGDPDNDLGVDLSNPRAHHGGDWQGIIDRLDYLEALGVTAIWISPVVANTGGGYHGYWTLAFDQPNPAFGDLATLRALVDAAHDRGIKVIVDVVINHVGHVFFYDRNDNGVEDEGEFAPPWDPGGVRTLDGSAPAPIVFYDDPDRGRFAPSPPEFANPDWYNRRGRIGDWDHPTQRLLGDFGGSKDLDTSHPEVRAALIRVFADWIEKTDVDGFRIDTVRHVEHDFLREFAEAMRAHAAALGKERFFLFGEALTGDVEELATYTSAGALDAVLDFRLHFAGFGDVFGRGGATRQLEELWHEKERLFGDAAHPGGIGVPPRRALVNFIDNHDVHRFLHDTPSPGALRAALAYLLTYDGVPTIYYGTEHLFDGGRDPANREDLWDSGYDTSGEMFAFIARLIEIRAERAALRRGDTRFRWSSTRTGGEQDAGVIAFERMTDDEVVLVVVNTHGVERETSASSLGFGDMRVSFAPGTELFDLLDPTAAPLTVDAEQHLVVRVPPHGVRILSPSP
jgi:alpha-amylase